MPRPRVGDDRGLRQAADIAGRVVARQHDDRRALLLPGGDLGPEPGPLGLVDQVLGQRHRTPADLRGAHLLHHVEPAELGVDRQHRGRAGLEPPGIGVERERARVEAELLPMGEPSGRPGREVAQQVGRA